MCSCGGSTYRGGWFCGWSQFVWSVRCGIPLRGIVVFGGGVLVELFFRVQGVPVQQGSKSVRLLRGRAQMFDQNAKALHPWRRRVADAAAAAALVQGVPMFCGAVAVVARFEFVRPRSAPASRVFPSVKPDLDKLVRALLDGVTASGAWRDDALVTRLSAMQRYVDSDPGVLVTVREDW